MGKFPISFYTLSIRINTIGEYMFKNIFKKRLSKFEVANSWIEYIEKYNAKTDIPDSFHKPLKFSSATCINYELESFTLNDLLGQLTFVSKYSPSYCLDYSIQHTGERSEVFISYGRRWQDKLIFNVSILEDGTINAVDILGKDGSIKDNYCDRSCIESFMFSIWYSSNPFISLS